MKYEQIILDRLEAGTLIRKAWTGIDAQGRQTACLLAAIAPPCGEYKSSLECPAEVMPRWLASLTPWIDDAGSEKRWPEFVRRFAATSPKWGRLTEQHEYAIRAIAVREAMQHTKNGEVLGVCRSVVTLCDRVAAGESVQDLGTPFRDAQVSVDVARTVWAAAAARNTRAAASAAAMATWGATAAATWALVDVAEAAGTTRAAERAVGAATAAAEKEKGAWWKVAEAAADRMIDQILAVLEAA
jgi:hypothetical protein